MKQLCFLLFVVLFFYLAALWCSGSALQQEHPGFESIWGCFGRTSMLSQCLSGFSPCTPDFLQTHAWGRLTGLTVSLNGYLSPCVSPVTDWTCPALLTYESWDRLCGLIPVLAELTCTITKLH